MEWRVREVYDEAKTDKHRLRGSKNGLERKHREHGRQEEQHKGKWAEGFMGRPIIKRLTCFLQPAGGGRRATSDVFRDGPKFAARFLSVSLSGRDPMQVAADREGPRYLPGYSFYPFTLSLLSCSCCILFLPYRPPFFFY